MSRTGKKPVSIPDKVKAQFTDGVVRVEGPLGKLQMIVGSFVDVSVQDKSVTVTRKDDSKECRQAHGLVRACIQNMVTGVSEGFKKDLVIEGVGYRAEVKGPILNLTLGYSHPVEFKIPTGIKIAVEKQTRIMLSGSDREQLGQVAANIRSLRPPEPYKGKGIRYDGEYIQRKVGKAAASGGK